MEPRFYRCCRLRSLMETKLPTASQLVSQSVNTNLHLQSLMISQILLLNSYAALSTTKRGRLAHFTGELYSTDTSHMSLES